MAACSFKAIVGGPCSYDRRDQTISAKALEKPPFDVRTSSERI